MTRYVLAVLAIAAPAWSDPAPCAAEAKPLVDVEQRYTLAPDGVAWAFDSGAWTFLYRDADQGKPGFHGDDVGVLSVIYSTQLSVVLERFDEKTPMADALAFTEEDSVVEDGFVRLRWSTDSVATLTNVRGDFTRADAASPWMFRPWPRLCARTHVAGDDRVFDAPLRVTGKATTAIPNTGLSGVYVTGTISAPDPPSSTPFAQSAFSVVADQVVRLEWRRPR
jgi:hypothetical protein